MTKVNRILIGGAMAYTFYKATVKAWATAYAKMNSSQRQRVQEKAKTAKCELLLPIDDVAAKNSKPAQKTKSLQAY